VYLFLLFTRVFVYISCVMEITDKNMKIFLKISFASWARVLLSSAYRVKPGYNDRGLCDTSSIPSDKFLKTKMAQILNNTLVSMLGFN
jgi:hypothetical protein